jgi:leucyl-tRNA synthetase
MIKSRFTAGNWSAFAKEQQERILYNIGWLIETEVNWCPGLGTVLANDEIVNGVSERGGFTVVRKKWHNGACVFQLMQNVCCRVEWYWLSESIKESQRNWLGNQLGLWLVPVMPVGIKAKITIVLLEKH